MTRRLDEELGAATTWLRHRRCRGRCLGAAGRDGCRRSLLTPRAAQTSRGQACASALRTRSSLTGCAVPSCWAHSETRSSSSIHRALRSRSPAGRPVGERGDLVQVEVLEVGDPVHQLAVAVDRRAALVERLAAQRQGAEVGRVAAQLLGTGLGQEARVHEPLELGLHVGQRREHAHLGAPAEQLVDGPPAVEHPHHLAEEGTQRGLGVGPRPRRPARRSRPRT